MREVRVVAPTGCLGYGFSKADYERVMSELRPHYVAVDAGSTDPGPYYLGAGVSFTSRVAVKDELATIIGSAVAADIPVVIANAGGAGGRPHVDWAADIVRELAHDNGWNFQMALIDSEVAATQVSKWLTDGRIRTFESGEPLTAEAVTNSTRIVAQMGPEPIIKALSDGAQIVVCGRCCDDAAFAAYPMMEDFPPGLALHMGKILECGALASEPIGMDVMLARLRDDHVLIEPGAAHRACTVTSIAGHSLYERENPIVQAGPGGEIDLSASVITQESERVVRVAGTAYRPAADYWVKLEGVAQVGYRTISIAGIRCPSMIGQLDAVITEARHRTERFLKTVGIEGCRLTVHCYGRDGVMGPLEPLRHRIPHEVGLVMEAVAATQEEAHAACHELSGALLHLDFPGQYNNAGNLAFLYSPSEIDTGPFFEFSVYHLARLDDPVGTFRITHEEVGSTLTAAGSGR